MPVAPKETVRSATPVTIVFHAVSGEPILGPEKYPSTTTLFQLQADLLKTTFARRCGADWVQLMHGDQVLEGVDSIACISGQETISLTCIFGKGLRISAHWNSPCRDWIAGWSLDVWPLDFDGQPAVEEWLLAVNEGKEPDCHGRSWTVQEIHGRDILSELGSHVKIELQKEEWDQLQALLQPSSGQCVHIKRWGNSLASVGGYRAAVGT